MEDDSFAPGPARLQALHARLRELANDAAHICEAVSVLDAFSGSPQLLDPILPYLVTTVSAGFLGSVPTAQTAPKAVRSASRADYAIFLYTLCKIRGVKTVSTLLSSEIPQLSQLLGILSSDTSEDPLTWQERFVALVWLSIVVLVPFPLHTIHVAGCADVKLEIYNVAWRYLSHPGKEREGAAWLMARFLARSDTNKYLAEFYAASEAPLASGGSAFLCLGLLDCLARLLSVARTELLRPHLAQHQRLLRLCQSDLGTSDEHKLVIKNSARLCLLLIRSASASDAELSEPSLSDHIEELIGSVLASVGHRDTIVRQSVAKALARIAESLDDAEMALEILAQIIDASDIPGISEIFADCATSDSASDADICRLPPELPASASPSKWHTVMLAIGEFSRRRLLPARTFRVIIPVVLRGLVFEQRRISFAVGGHVRDAACFAVWALVRSTPTAQFTVVQLRLLVAGLVIVACFDREIHVRRAAAAAAQETIGRHNCALAAGFAECESGVFGREGGAERVQDYDVFTTSGNMASVSGSATESATDSATTSALHSLLQLVQALDFVALGRTSHAFLFVALRVDSVCLWFRGAMLSHLVARGVTSWDPKIRTLAAEALGRLFRRLGSAARAAVLAPLVAQLSPPVPDGVLLGVAACVAAERAGPSVPSEGSAVSVGLAQKLAEVLLMLGPQIDNVRDPAPKAEEVLRLYAALLWFVEGQKEKEADEEAGEEAIPLEAQLEEIQTFFLVLLRREDPSLRHALQEVSRWLSGPLPSTLGHWLRLVATGHVNAAAALLDLPLFQFGSGTAPHSPQLTQSAAYRQVLRLILQPATPPAAAAALIRGLTRNLQRVPGGFSGAALSHSSVIPIVAQITATVAVLLNDYRVTEQGDVGSQTRSAAVEFVSVHSEFVHKGQAEVRISCMSSLLRGVFDPIDRLRVASARAVAQLGGPLAVYEVPLQETAEEAEAEADVEAETEAAEAVNDMTQAAEPLESFWARATAVIVALTESADATSGEKCEPNRWLLEMARGLVCCAGAQRLGDGAKAAIRAALLRSYAQADATARERLVRRFVYILRFPCEICAGLLAEVANSEKTAEETEEMETAEIEAIFSVPRVTSVAHLIADREKKTVSSCVAVLALLVDAGLTLPRGTNFDILFVRLYNLQLRGAAVPRVAACVRVFSALAADCPDVAVRGRAFRQLVALCTDRRDNRVRCVAAVALADALVERLNCGAAGGNGNLEKAVLLVADTDWARAERPTAELKALLKEEMTV